MKQRTNRQGANVIAVAVRMAGGPSRVAPLLGVSRSQVHRWIEAGTMSRAIYSHVAALAKLTGIRIEFLGGDPELRVDRERATQTAARANAKAAIGKNSKVSASRPEPRNLKLSTVRKDGLASSLAHSASGHPRGAEVKGALRVEQS